MIEHAPRRRGLGSAVLLAAMLGASCGPVDAPAPLGNQRVQASGAAADALKAAHATILQDYGGFLIFEATPAQLDSVPEWALVESRTNDTTIHLNSGPLDTTAPPMSRRSSALTVAGRGLHLVQFDGPVRPEWQAKLNNNGFRVVSYVPNNAYLVYGDASALDRLQQPTTAGPEVRWHGPYLPAHKVSPFAGIAPGAYAIQLVADDAANAATLALARTFTREPIRSSRALGYVNLALRAGPEAVNALAQRPDVVSILPDGERRMLDERQDVIIAGRLSGNLPIGPGYLDWLASKGFTQEQFDASGFGVDVSDSGIDNGTITPNHFGLYARGDVTGASRIVYNRLEGVASPNHTLAGCDGHGTINAHIVGGYGRAGGPFSDSDGYQYGLGVAPFVRIGSSVVFDPFFFTAPVYEDLQSRAHADGMRVSSNSWGSNVGFYDSDAQRYDALVRDAAPPGSAAAQGGNQEMTVVFAAGNSGSNALRVNVLSPGNAKNVITVGASENSRPFGAPDLCRVADDAADSALDVAFFSSQGPTLDGRVKPDLLAPGTHVVGGVAQTDAQRASPPASPTGEALSCFEGFGVCGGTVDAFFPAGQRWYTASSGTSHSTPAVAGAAALLRQWFLNHGLPAPSPAMTKAYLANGARYATGAGGNLPSNAQGMGLLDLGASFEDMPRLLRDQVPEDLFAATGQTRVFHGTADPSKPVRVTLAWTDAPGPTFASAWVNDLDLSVTAGGVTYLGNVFSGPASVAGGSPDRKNNLESVFLPSGVSGPFTVTVTAANIAGDGVPGNDFALDQDFALVVTNSCTDAVPRVPGGATAMATGLNEITLDWSADGQFQYVIERATGAAGPFERVTTVAAPPFVDSGRSGGATYFYRVLALSGCAASAPSATVSVTATGACLQPPRFAGLRTAASTGLMTCGNGLSWTAATPSCGGTIAYDVHRATSASFVPSPANRIATVTGTSYVDSGDLVDGTRYFYVVRAVETSVSGQMADRNTFAPSAVPSWIETLFEDDFDQHRPADPAALWQEDPFGGSNQLSVVTGCHWQSATGAYRFGTPDSCRGYRGSASGFPYYVTSLLVLGGDGASPMNGFFIPPSSRATLRFRHTYRFRGYDIHGGDGATLLYSTTGPPSFNRVLMDWEHLLTPEPTPYLVEGSFISRTWADHPGWTFSDSETDGQLTQVVLNADALSDRNVWFAWLFATKEAEQEEGYVIDDVRLELQRRCSTSPVPASAPARFRVDGLPSSTVVDVPLSFTVTALDASGQVATAYAGTAQVTTNDPLSVFPATLSFSSGTAQGVVQFRTSGPHAIHATDSSGLAHGAGVTRVNPGPARSIRFSMQPPTSVTTDDLWKTEVAMADAFGNGVDAGVSLSLGENPGGEPPLGYTIFPVVDGHTLFMLSMNKVGKGYTLVASGGGLTATSVPFDVLPGFPRTLVFIHEPANAVACEPVAPAVSVAAFDEAGNVADVTGRPISLQLEATGPADLRGTSSILASGVAVFSGLSILKPGTGYVLLALDGFGQLPAGRSAPFDVTLGPAKRLLITGQPHSVVAGARFSEPLTVSVSDACGNAITTDPERVVSATLATNPPLGDLLGEMSVRTGPGGVAEFTDLAIDRAGSGYVLRVETSGLGGDVSDPFTVEPGPPSRYVLSASDKAMVGVPTLFHATAQDRQSNDVNGYLGFARLTVSDARASFPETVSFDRSQGAEFRILFANTGTHTVTLTEIGSLGELVQGAITVTVTAPAPAPSGGCASGSDADLALLGLMLAAVRRSRKRTSLLGQWVEK